MSKEIERIVAWFKEDPWVRVSLAISIFVIIILLIILARRGR